MSLPRTIVLDLLNRYPDANTVEEAATAHFGSLKVTAQDKKQQAKQKQEEFEAAALELVQFDNLCKAPFPTAMQAEPAKLESAPAVTMICGRAIESRIRPETQVVEYLYSSRRYLTNAKRLGVGTLDDTGTRMWLSRREVARCRQLVSPDTVPAATPARPRQRRFLGSRDERARKGTSLKERCYASGEYIAYASRNGIGTVEGGYVYLTDAELQQVREISRIRALERGDS